MVKHHGGFGETALPITGRSGSPSRPSIISVSVSVAILIHCAAVASPAVEYKQGTIHFKDVPGIHSISFKSAFHGYNSAVNRPLTGGKAAYDYSVDIIRDRDVYRMYAGGRWKRSGVKFADGDHVLQYVSKDGAAGTWTMPRDRPEFWNGAEDGEPGKWYSSNTLEPEVMKVGGRYFMFTQVMVRPGFPTDLPGQNAVTEADRIQLFTSPDGTDWTRFAERGVVVNLDDPCATSLHHQELLYVPWDKDKRPFWLYVAAKVNRTNEGYSRIRSADPKTFDWRRREKGANLGQLGNQLAYAKQAPGGPLFIRITFVADKTGRKVPSLQFSRDGMAWFVGDDGPVKLDGSKDDADNKNCYFLGISTIDGTGELEYLGNNTFHAIYGATTSNSPTAPAIFKSEIGVGDLIFTIR